MLAIVLLLVLNFAISWWNCYAVGGMWAEAKALGGFPRLLAWSAATQAAIGFSTVAGFLAGAILHEFGYLPARAVNAALSLFYVLIIIPAIGTGLILTIHSWIIAFRERSLLNMGTAAYNTFAQIHNMYQAVEGIPAALGTVADFFSSDDDDAPAALLVIGLVIGALTAGIVLTAVLIKHYASRLPLPERAPV